jgi:hypothetical protein
LTPVSRVTWGLLHAEGNGSQRRFRFSVKHDRITDGKT